MCPKKKAMFEAREEKDKMRENGHIQTKVLSDSTMRLADPLGTKSEICTMSGGGLGQVTQAALDDPDISNKQEIFLIGGANDVKFKNFSLPEFCANVELSLTKVKQLVEAHPDKSITSIETPPQPRTFNDGLSDDEGDESDDVDNDREDDGENDNIWIKKEYLHRRIRQMVNDAAEQNVKNLHSIRVEYGVDESDHPTPVGTTNILERIADESKSENFIWNEQFIITDKLYSKVEAIYIYGCNSCDKYGSDVSREVKRCRLLCDSCYEIMQKKAESENYPILDVIISESNERNDENADTATKPGQKRGLNVNSSDEEAEDAKRLITENNSSTPESSIQPDHQINADVDG